MRVSARGRGWGRTRRRVGMGVGVRVGFEDSVGVQSGQKFPSGAFGAHGLLRPASLTINCRLEAPRGRGVVGVIGPAESPPPPCTRAELRRCLNQSVFSRALQMPARWNQRAPGLGVEGHEQRILSSHIPPCHRHMVIATDHSSLFCFVALQRKPDQYRNKISGALHRDMRALSFPTVNHVDRRTPKE